jgi:hypothetical protein
VPVPVAVPVGVGGGAASTPVLPEDDEDDDDDEEDDDDDDDDDDVPSSSSSSSSVREFRPASLVVWRLVDLLSETYGEPSTSAGWQAFVAATRIAAVRNVMTANGTVLLPNTVICNRDPVPALHEVHRVGQIMGSVFPG